ncbi:MAG: hypothetical protein JWP97_4609 [Labilithrix sp.]|nr:hypothetical protein [Labilithrix sp.]
MKAVHSPLTPLLVPACARPPAPKRINVADRVARSFPPTACVVGYQYFARKRVDLLSVSASAIEAEVKGKRTHRASLRAAGGKLAAACTCTASLVGPAACRHVWAALLEVDRQSLFESLRATERSLPLDVVEAKVESARAERVQAAKGGGGGKAARSAAKISAAPPKKAQRAAAARARP